jgi:hypothetical protein
LAFFYLFFLSLIRSPPFARPLHWLVALFSFFPHCAVTTAERGAWFLFGVRPSVSDGGLVSFCDKLALALGADLKQQKPDRAAASRLVLFACCRPIQIIGQLDLRIDSSY